MRRLNVISLDTSIREEGYRKEKKGHETGEPQKDPNRDTVSRHGEKTGSVDYTISRHSPVVHAITKDYGKHASKTQTASKDMKILVRSGVDRLFMIHRRQVTTTSLRNLYEERTSIGLRIRITEQCSSFSVRVLASLSLAG